MINPTTDFQHLVIFVITLPIVAIVFLLAPYVFSSFRPRNFPNGPRTIPILGNVHLLPPTKAFLQMHEWRKKYGSIIGLKLGPRNAVILNDYRDVEELFERRGAIYSSRPFNYLGQTLMCPDDLNILFTDYGPAYKDLRRIATTFLAKDLMPIKNAEITQTVRDILRDPDNFDKHIKRCTTSIYTAIVYGKRGARFDTPWIQDFYDVQDRFTEILDPGATPPMNEFTFLQLLPRFLAPWKSKAEAIRRDQSRLYHTLMEGVKERMRQGNDPPCFMKDMLLDQEKSGQDDEHMAYNGGALMEAASDTTSSTLLSCIFGLITNPNAIVKAQEEVDRVCGNKRMPQPDDIAGMKYVAACVTEALRWRPVVPSGMPHSLTQDDTYKGYKFPAGTMFFANAWSIHRSEDDYEDPDDFIPDRWLHHPKGLKADQEVVMRRKETYTFGAGRRICAGQKMADNSMRLALAKLVWAFDFGQGRDGAIDSNILTAFNDGLSMGPKKFDAGIRVRSSERAEVIEKEFGDLAPFFEQYITE